MYLVGGDYPTLCTDWCGLSVYVERGGGCKDIDVCSVSTSELEILA